MPASFKPQLVIPADGDPYYNTISAGGYNPCIKGNPKSRKPGLNVLPNCCGYATGRWNQIYHEILGGSGCEYLGNTNAANYIDLARKQGLTVTQRPTVGGCMVWRGGNTGEGHVAIVELDLGSRVVTSESEYYGKAFTTYKRTGRNWSEGCYWMRSSYKYLGCIVNPAVITEKDEDSMTKEERYAEWLEFEKRHKKELAKQPASEWAVPAIDRVKAAGIMGGDPDGNFRPQDNVTRQEMAQTFSNILPDNSLLPK